jgi:hypothetical protein
MRRINPDPKYGTRGADFVLLKASVQSGSQEPVHDLLWNAFYFRLQNGEKSHASAVLDRETAPHRHTFDDAKPSVRCANTPRHCLNESQLSARHAALRQDSIVKDLLLVSPTADALPWHFCVGFFPGRKKLVPNYYLNPDVGERNETRRE